MKGGVRQAMRQGTPGDDGADLVAGGTTHSDQAARRTSARPALSPQTSP